MHELSLVEGIIKNIEEQKIKYGFSKVKAVEIICGKYNCLSEDSLQFCFDVAVKTTYMEGARLKIKRTESDNAIYLNELEVE